MNGRDVVLDTNALIYFFEGRPKIKTMVEKAPQVYYASVSEIEVLSASHLSNTERNKIKTFLVHNKRVELSQVVIDVAIELRREYRMKTPDAIVAATALYLNMPLASADDGMKRVKGLELITDIV